MEKQVRNILEAASDETLADAILDSYKEVERNYFTKSWKTSELDAGHFVEAVRRFLSFKLVGQYIPIGKTLPSLNDVEIKKILAEKGNDSYRMHIPRVLVVINGIRNKRGVGHLAKLNPNHLDATLIMANVKWVIAELVRLNSQLDASETVKIVDHIVERHVEGMWEEHDITRILVDGLNIKEKIIFLLFSTDHNLDDKLFEIIEYSNKSYFKKILKQLHKERLIEYKSDGTCVISPKGVLYAEKIILEKVKV